jgi:putative transcriptional regulator
MGSYVKNFVQDYRNKHKITQEELGAHVGVTRQTIIAIEKGNYTPSVLLALKIANFFHTEVEKLFILE